MDKRRGLVIIYDPHALMLFLKFYCMKENNSISWDALCLPKENGKQEMETFCKRAGVFNKIYTSDIEFSNISVVKKGILFFVMLIYAVFRNQKKFAKKIFDYMVDDIEAYDCYSGNTESGFMVGLLASFAKEKKVIYFEDGSADYTIERKKNQSFFKKGSFLNFQCITMARLGYFGKGYVYFEPTKHCYKYASVPDELAYKNYKRIFGLKLSKKEEDVYKTIIEKIYPELKQYKKINKNSKLVLTIAMTPNNIYKDEYAHKYESYINEHANEIYVKKHPRDDRRYSFNQDVIVHEVPRDIPAELLFPFFNGHECFMMEPDSTLLNMSTCNLIVNVIYFDDYCLEDQKIFNNWKNKEYFQFYCERFIKNKYRFITL